LLNSFNALTGEKFLNVENFFNVLAGLTLSVPAPAQCPEQIDGGRQGGQPCLRDAQFFPRVVSRDFAP
jgi:hypothetical protein